jgi:hypothetical protein
VLHYKINGNVVAKVGHAHAGYGKVKLKSAEEVADFRSLVALNGDYVTMEPFIVWDFDMRYIPRYLKLLISTAYKRLDHITEDLEGSLLIGRGTLGISPL